MGDKEKKDEFPLLAKILNGGIAGIIGVACVYPIDLVKTRLQNQTIGPGGEKMYTSMFDCFVKSVRSEGLIGMYKGAPVNLTLVFPEKAIKFASNDFFRYYLSAPEIVLSLPRQMLAAALAAVCQLSITTPMDLVKIQMQDAGRAAAEAKASGLVVQQRTFNHIVFDLIKGKGILGLYRGTVPTLSRDVFFNVIYFPLFAHINDSGPKRDDGSGEAVTWWSFIAGLSAGATAAFSATPFDVIKTRIQASRKDADVHHYTGFIDIFRKTLNNEGSLAFFKGGACRIMVIAPMFGITQAIYFFGVAESLLGMKHFKTV